ncbi:MAG: ABC transporter substrate-binding protein [Flavobacteriaceae bacterium]|nr:ABC transporter substrate-binding protein [Flavobacteriaceae bacterium]
MRKWIAKVLNFIKIALCFWVVILFFSSCDTDQKHEEQKVFRYNEHANITSLDPAFAKDQRNIWPCHQLFNGLVQLNEQLQVIPDLAESWEISDDLLTYRFNLRKEVLFHQDSLVFNHRDERIMTAEDVIFSFYRLTDPKTASSGAWVMQQVDSVFAINKYSVEIQLKKAFPPFLGLLSNTYFSVVSKQAVEYYGSEFSRNPIGTGAFRFKRWEENVKLVLLKNPDYFESENGQPLPHLDAISIRFLPDKQAEFLEFVQGKLDFLNGVDATYKDEILTSSGELQASYRERFYLQRTPQLNIEYIGFNTSDSLSPVAYVHFRKALNFAFDRKAMVRFLKNGIGEAAERGFVPTSLAGSTSDKGFFHATDSAEYYLQQFKLQSGIERPKISISTNANYLDLVEYLQNQWQQIGVEVSINLMPPSSLRQMRSNGELETFRASWIADYPDAENFLSLFYAPNKSPNGPNYTFFENKNYDALYKKAAATVSDSSRYQLYQQMDAMIIKHAPVVPLYYDEVIRFVPKNIKGLPLNPLNLLELKRVQKI